MFLNLFNFNVSSYLVFNARYSKHHFELLKTFWINAVLKLKEQVNTKIVKNLYALKQSFLFVLLKLENFQIRQKFKISFKTKKLWLFMRVIPLVQKTSLARYTPISEFTKEQFYDLVFNFLIPNVSEEEDNEDLNYTFFTKNKRFLDFKFNDFSILNLFNFFVRQTHSRSKSYFTVVPITIFHRAFKMQESFFVNKSFKKIGSRINNAVNYLEGYELKHFEINRIISAITILTIPYMHFYAFLLDHTDIWSDLLNDLQIYFRKGYI